ncbi:hypothetical protein [Candidatus Paracaedibacter symbiosus]|uniref:hypothetical protein n=1 Tax=Candidatus Paracaedibacter symbiosus TaxID=244582 RepID=UPI000509E887|nr:hypothetical protein [Candidatus Paracaedibacter symbiosus]
MKTTQNNSLKVLLATMACISLPFSLANARFIPSLSCLDTMPSEVVTPNPLYQKMYIEKGSDEIPEEYTPQSFDTKRFNGTSTLIIEKIKSASHYLDSKSSEIVIPNPLYQKMHRDKGNDEIPEEYMLQIFGSKGFTDKIKFAFTRVFNKNYKYDKTLLLLDDSEDESSPLSWESGDSWTSTYSSESQKDPWN